MLSGEDLWGIGGLLNQDALREGKTVYGEPEEMSFQGLRPFLPPTAVQGLLQMMFLDCITDNTGRHGSNFLFAIDERQAITEMLPLYDHGRCFEGTRLARGGQNDGFMRGRRGWGPMGDGSSFPYYGQGGFFCNFPFPVLYDHMRSDYPAFIGEMVSIMRSEGFRQVAAKLECYDFLIDKLEAFENQGR